MCHSGCAYADKIIVLTFFRGACIPTWLRRPCVSPIVSTSGCGRDDDACFLQSRIGTTNGGGSFGIGYRCTPPPLHLLPHSRHCSRRDGLGLKGWQLVAIGREVYQFFNYKYRDVSYIHLCVNKFQHPDCGIIYVYICGTSFANNFGQNGRCVLFYFKRIISGIYNIYR